MIGLEITYRWELTAGALTRSLFLLPWGSLSNLGSFSTFFFFISADLEVPSLGCLWPDFSLELFYGTLVRTSIFSHHEFCIQLSTSCLANPSPGWSAPSGPTTAVSSLPMMCQVQLLPPSGISKGSHHKLSAKLEQGAIVIKIKKKLTAIGTGLRTKIHHKYCSGFSAALQPAQRSSLMCSCTLQSICTLLHLFSHQVTPSQLEDLAGCASSHLWTCLQRFHNPSRQDFNLSPCFKCRLKSWAWPFWRSNFFPSTGTPQWLCILHLAK